MGHLVSFPESKSGKRSILVCIERLSGYPWAWAVPDHTAFTTPQCVKELVSTIGQPGTISCDNGGGFKYNLIQKFCKTMKIKVSYNVPYQPEWMGAVERMNYTIRYALAKACDEDYSEWVLRLPEVIGGIRMRVSSRTGYSMFYLMYGVKSRIPIIWDINTQNNNMEIREMEIKTIPGASTDSMRLGKSATVLPRFEVGSMVMVLNGRILKRTPLAKTAPRYEGPYKVLTVHAHGIYSLESELGALQTCHVSRLVKFVPRVIAPQSEKGESEMQQCI
ncbi:Pol polyprotein [Smittium mucronatum]|uniref:Pol polyprotein n=1 Tax=Smittium mucronatum TaxID=133383 RepID=A0A1R0GZA0_9FUNG|nr:Pol polyprotein [Smittium mucronatum]